MANKVNVHFRRFSVISLFRWIHVVANVGNRIANNYYEHNLPKDFKRPTVQDGIKRKRRKSSLCVRGYVGIYSGVAAVERFIRAKYERLEYVPKGNPPPPCSIIGARSRVGMFKRQPLLE